MRGTDINYWLVVSEGAAVNLFRLESLVLYVRVSDMDMDSLYI